MTIINLINVNSKFQLLINAHQVHQFLDILSLTERFVIDQEIPCIYEEGWVIDTHTNRF